jgi:hypothetical protein
LLNRRGQADGNNKPSIVSSLLQDVDDTDNTDENVKQIAVSLFAGILLDSNNFAPQADLKAKQAAQIR